MPAAAHRVHGPTSTPVAREGPAAAREGGCDRRQRHPKPLLLRGCPGALTVESSPEGDFGPAAAAAGRHARGRPP